LALLDQKGEQVALTAKITAHADAVRRRLIGEDDLAENRTRP
jgi:hypothetical protein